MSAFRPPINPPPHPIHIACRRVLPQVGNGDVVSVSSALALLEATNCDGIMVGRGALQVSATPSGLPVLFHLSLVSLFSDSERTERWIDMPQLTRQLLETACC